MDKKKTPPGSDVGYKKPPVATRFKPGQSGNPKGRSKGAKSFRTVLMSELNTRAEVTVRGRRKKMSMRQAFAKQLVTSSVAGNTKSWPLLLAEIRSAEAAMAAATAGLIAHAPAPEDQLVIENMIKRVRLAVLSEPAAATAENPAEDNSDPKEGE